MDNTDLAMIIVIIYPVAFITIYGLSCIARREFKAEKLVKMCKHAIRETLVKDAIEGYGLNPESVRLLDETLTAIEISEGAKNTEQQVRTDKSGKCFYPKAFIVCRWFETGLCKSPNGICRST